MISALPGGFGKERPPGLSFLKAEMVVGLPKTRGIDVWGPWLPADLIDHQNHLQSSAVGVFSESSFSEYSWMASKPSSKKKERDGESLCVQHSKRWVRNRNIVCSKPWNLLLPSLGAVVGAVSEGLKEWHSSEYSLLQQSRLYQCLTRWWASSSLGVKAVTSGGALGGQRETKQPCWEGSFS